MRQKTVVGLRTYSDAVKEPFEPVVDIRDVQGDLILGFNKAYTYRLILNLAKDEKAPGVAKEWLKDTVIPNITTCYDIRTYRDTKKLKGGYFDTSDPLVWSNIAFGHGCISSLLRNTQYQEDVKKFDKSSNNPSEFTVGGKRKSWQVGDDPNKWDWGNDPNDNTFQNDDFLLTISSDNEAAVESFTKNLMDTAQVSGGFDSKMTLIRAFRGIKDDFMYGHEHYGFHDSLSEPTVRGKFVDDSGKEQYIVKRYLDESDPRWSQYSAPGFELMDTARFVLGSEYSAPLPADGLFNTPPLYPEWCHNGGFSVFRQLKQDVHDFWQQLYDQAQSILKEKNQPVDDETVKNFAGQIAAKCVGRWWDGTPLIFAEGSNQQPLTGHFYPPKVGTPGIDPNASAQMTWEKNGFLFKQSEQKWKTITGNTIAFPFSKDGTFPSDANPQKEVCPFASHIRKVNPRDMSTDQGPPAETLKHRVIRRGNNYGTRVNDVFGPDDSQERGLSLVLHVASIYDQFMFLQLQWANNTSAPEDGGDDVIIGLRNNGVGSDPVERYLKTDLVLPDGTLIADSIKANSYFTQAVGMGYFLLPPMKALTSILTTPASE